MLTLGFSLRCSWSWCLFGLCSGTPGAPPPPCNSTTPPLSPPLARLYWFCQFHILCSAVLFLFLLLLPLLHLRLFRLQLFLLYFEIASVVFVVVAVFLTSLFFLVYFVYCILPMCFSRNSVTDTLP